MIWLARHGETTWNVAGRYQGRLESPLSALGERQAEALAAYFSERPARGEAVPERVVSSPLGRCTATALPVARALHLALETDERLIEIAHGTWEGRYRAEIERDDSARFRLWREEPARVRFTGGESLAEVSQRWRAFAATLADDARSLLVMTHDAVLRCALVDLLGLPLAAFWEVPVENGAFAMLARDAGRLTIVRTCETSHLAGLRAEVGGQAL